MTSVSMRLTLAPALAVFLIMSRYEGVHDRYLYLPSVAFALLIGAAWACIFPETNERRALLKPAAAAVVLMALLVLLALFLLNSASQ